MILPRPLLASLLALVLAACSTSLANDPVNVRLADAGLEATVAPASEPVDVGDVIIGLSFSGGGTRAAAFAHGVLEQLQATPITIAGKPQTLLQQVQFVSGVSGGAVTAAYFGLHGPKALTDFRDRFLIRNAEENLRTSFSPTNLIRLSEGGVNDATGFPRWLDKNLFNGATFASLNQPGRPRIFINASDIFNRSPFIFAPLTFQTICSDLNRYPLASAVAASAAVPVVFAPVVIETFPAGCNTPLPPWVETAPGDPNAPAVLRSFANAFTRYRSGEIDFIKLLDGGITDNLGLQGFLMARLSANAPYKPLSERQAVRVREIVIFVVNAGRGPSGDWVRTVEGPSGRELINAVSDTMIDSGVRNSLDALKLAMKDWETALIRHRCTMPRTKVLELRGTLRGWSCRDMKIRVTEIGFEALDAPTRTAVDKVETRFKLPTDQVDLTIAAGRQALSANSVYRGLVD